MSRFSDYLRIALMVLGAGLTGCETSTRTEPLPFRDSAVYRGVTFDLEAIEFARSHPEIENARKAAVGLDFSALVRVDVTTSRSFDQARVTSQTGKPFLYFYGLDCEIDPEISVGRNIRFWCIIIDAQGIVLGGDENLTLWPNFDGFWTDADFEADPVLRGVVFPTRFQDARIPRVE